METARKMTQFLKNINYKGEKGREVGEGNSTLEETRRHPIIKCIDLT